MIEAVGLSKFYEDFLAVDDVNLNVATGAVLALLGPNGAGKTTTVRMLTSILAPSAGWARVAGYDVVAHPEKVRSSVGVLTEQHGLYERMKAVEYLDFFGRLYHLAPEVRKKRSLDLMERFGLTFALNKKLGDYSKGMKQKLALVRAMLHDPPVLLLDEPTSAMDPQSAKQVRDAIEELQRDARTFMITTHNLTEAEQLADTIAIIRRGRIIASGSIDALGRRFAGEPLMELRLGAPINGYRADLERAFDGKLTVQDTGDTWLRYEPAGTAADVNPLVIRHAVNQGLDVQALVPLTRSLEDIYLQAVKEDEAQGGARGEHLR